MKGISKSVKFFAADFAWVGKIKQTGSESIWRGSRPADRLEEIKTNMSRGHMIVISGSGRNEN